MNIKSSIIPILLATMWVSTSEFFRNQVLLQSYWTNHYESLGIAFPSDPINGALWGLWSLIFATLIYVIASKFSFVETTLIAWVMGFIMMWVVIGNLSVLPMGLLWFAVPLSLFEAFIATWIVKRFQRPS